jgi:hypothetical protein
MQRQRHHRRNSSTDTQQRKKFTHAKIHVLPQCKDLAAIVKSLARSSRVNLERKKTAELAALLIKSKRHRLRRPLPQQ